jgi:hypothetical protein
MHWGVDRHFIRPPIDERKKLVLIEKISLVSMCFVAVGIVFSSGQEGKAGERIIPPIPHKVMCEMSGYDLGSSQNAGCTALLNTFPPRQYPVGFHKAVVRSIEMWRGGSECTLIGNAREMVQCGMPKVLPTRTKPENLKEIVQ